LRAFLFAVLTLTIIVGGSTFGQAGGFNGSDGGGPEFGPAGTVLDAGAQSGDGAVTTGLISSW